MISFHLFEVTFMLIKQEIEKANADAKLETQGEWDMMKFIKLAGIITATALLVNTTIADAAHGHNSREFVIMFLESELIKLTIDSGRRHAKSSCNIS